MVPSSSEHSSRWVFHYPRVSRAIGGTPKRRQLEVQKALSIGQAAGQQQQQRVLGTAGRHGEQQQEISGGATKLAHERGQGAAAGRQQQATDRGQRQQQQQQRERQRQQLPGGGAAAGVALGNHSSDEVDEAVDCRRMLWFTAVVSGPGLPLALIGKAPESQQSTARMAGATALRSTARVLWQLPGPWIALGATHMGPACMGEAAWNRALSGNNDGATWLLWAVRRTAAPTARSMRSCCALRCCQPGSLRPPWCRCCSTPTSPAS